MGWQIAKVLEYCETFNSSKEYVMRLRLMREVEKRATRDGFPKAILLLMLCVGGLISIGCEREQPNRLFQSEKYTHTPEIYVDPIVLDEGDGYSYLRIVVDASNDNIYPSRPLRLWAPPIGDEPVETGMVAHAGKQLVFHGIKIPEVVEVTEPGGMTDPDQRTPTYRSDLPLALYFRCNPGFKPENAFRFSLLFFQPGVNVEPPGKPRTLDVSQTVTLSDLPLAQDARFDQFDDLPFIYTVPPTSDER